MRIVLSAMVLLAFIGTTGCEQGKLSVTGTVKYDGKEVDEGDMIFEPDNKSLAPEGAKIKGGKYSANLPKGKYKVRITANRTIPGKKGPMGEDAVEQYIPKKYNEETTLTADVTGDKKSIDFEMPK